MVGYLLNCWYMAAWADELGRTPVARRLLDLDLVIFRTETGRPVVLLDRCPHRFAPLSMGTVRGEIIQCGYHGLGFDGDGSCKLSPFGLTVPPATVVRAFPVFEKDNCLWFWPGPPEAADPATIPDFDYHVDPSFRVVKDRSVIKAHYELVTDNLMDLTHTRYLHPGFGGDDWVPEVSFSQDRDTVFSHYELPSYPASEFSEAFMPSGGKAVRERDYIRWNVPASMYLHIELGLAETPDRMDAVQPSTHILTPETETTCHYFWASGAEVGAPVTDADHYDAVKFAFDQEDAPMLEAVQRAVGAIDFWDLKPAILAHDNGAIRARRILRQRVRQEQSAEIKAVTG